MNKLFKYVLIGGMVLNLVACGGQETTKQDQPKQDEPKQETVDKAPVEEKATKEVEEVEPEVIEGYTLEELIAVAENEEEFLKLPIETRLDIDMYYWQADDYDMTKKDPEVTVGEKVVDVFDGVKTIQYTLECVELGYGEDDDLVFSMTVVLTVDEATGDFKMLELYMNPDDDGICLVPYFAYSLGLTQDEDIYNIFDDGVDMIEGDDDVIMWIEYLEDQPAYASIELVDDVFEE